MTHQMQNLCVFSVLHCVEGAFGAASGGTPKMKMGLRQTNSKMVVVAVGPALWKTTQNTKEFLPIPYPEEPWKNSRKHSKHQGVSLVRKEQQNLKHQGMEDQEGAGQSCLCVALFRGKKRKLINKTPRKSQENAATVLEQSRHNSGTVPWKKMVYVGPPRALRGDSPAGQDCGKPLFLLELSLYLSTLASDIALTCITYYRCPAAARLGYLSLDRKWHWITCVVLIVEKILPP